jgi:hypothetical protein
MGRARSMVTTVVNVSGLIGAFWAFFIPSNLVTAGSNNANPSLNKVDEAINQVFAQYSGSTLLLPLSDQPVHASVRPLCSAAIKPLQSNFSVRRQENIESALHRLSDLVDARDRLAKKLGIEEKWSWPSGIDRLKVDAVITQDVLTGRSENPDEMSISSPKIRDKRVEITVEEDYTEHGQDRVLGHGHRISLVTLVPENSGWVIDEIKTTTIDAYGDTTKETLTKRLQETVSCFDNITRAIEHVAARKEVRRGVKADN